MYRIKRPYLLPLFFIILISCFEKDERVSPYPGQVYTIYDSIQVCQSYFDLETGQVVRMHRVDAWQLGFECQQEGWHIVVNSGANWFIYNTGQDLIDGSTTMPADLAGLYDIQAAYPDSTAVGKWVDTVGQDINYTRHVYLLGKYLDGNFINLKQLVFLEVTDTTYRFWYKESSGEFSDTVTISKTDTANFVYYSFPERKQVNLEPNKSDYDVVFGSYYDLATQFGITIPYLVGGALLNVWQTAAYLDSISGYNHINFETIHHQSFSTQRDIPGYRWKSVSVDITGGGIATYKVKTHYTYIFQTAQENYYKLRFLSYTLNGKSGFPQFEYRKLSPAEIIP